MKIRNFILTIILVCCISLSSVVEVKAVDNATNHNLPNAASSDFKASIYLQWQVKNCDKPYSEMSGRTLHGMGCGYCTACGIYTSTTGKKKDAVEVCRKYAPKHYCPGSGSYHTVIPAILGDWGFKVKGIGANKKQFLDYLRNGYMVGAITSSVFTSAGHFVYFYGYKKEGSKEYCRVATSSKDEQNSQWFAISTVMGSLNMGASNGGPLWAVTEYSGSDKAENGSAPTTPETSTQDSLEITEIGAAMSETDFAVYDNWDSSLVAMATKEGLSVNEQKQVATWGNNIETNSMTYISFMRRLISFLGIMITIWCLFFYLSYWLDRVNTFIDVSMMSIVTMGSLQISPDNSSTFNKSSSEVSKGQVKLVNQRDVIFITVVGCVVGILLISGKIYYLLDMLMSVMQKIV